MAFSEPSVKSLYLEMRFNGQKLASGAGFLVQKDNCVYLITNRHNATGRNNETNEVISQICGIPNEVATEMLNSRSTVSIAALSGGKNLATSLFRCRPLIQDSIEATTILTQGGC